MATRNTFSFVGKIVPIKDTDTFKGYTEQVFDSKWMNQRLRFNVIAGDNRHLVEINAGRWQDEKKNTVVYAVSKDKEKIQIPYEKRNDPAEIEKIAGYCIFTVDTDTYQHRQELKESKDEEALEASNKKRKHFIVGTDFLEWTKKVVYSDKIKDMTFRINGNINYSYSEKTGKYYSSYEVTKIYRVENDAKPTSSLNIHFYYTEGFMDKDSIEDYGKAIMNGYTQFYDSQTKAYWFTPMTVIMREDNLEKANETESLLSNFEDNAVCYTQLSCQAIDGAQKQDVTVADLPEKVQKAIALGLKDEKQALRDAGSQVYGEKVQEIRFDEIGSKMSEATAYEADVLVEKPHLKEDNKEDAVPFDVDEDDDI